MYQQKLQEWRQKWDSMQGNDFIKAKELLFAYAGSFRSIPILGMKHVWGGDIGRFFSGHRNTHYGNVVQETLATFHNQDSLGSIDSGLMGELFVKRTEKKSGWQSIKYP